MDEVDEKENIKVCPKHYPGDTYSSVHLLEAYSMSLRGKSWTQEVCATTSTTLQVLSKYIWT